MANVAFSTLYDLILPYLPGAETPIVDNQIRKVLRDFLQRTTLQRESFTLTTTAGVATYALTPTYGIVSAVLRVWRPDSPRPLPPLAEHYQFPLESGEPAMWTNVIPSILKLHPVPDDVYTYYVDTALTAAQDTTELPEELVHHYGEVIAAGVLSAMMAMPGKPWTQADASKITGRMYAGKVRELRGHVREGGQPNHSTFRGVARFGA